MSVGVKTIDVELKDGEKTQVFQAICSRCPFWEDETQGDPIDAQTRAKKHLKERHAVELEEKPRDSLTGNVQPQLDVTITVDDVAEVQDIMAEQPGEVDTREDTFDGGGGGDFGGGGASDDFGN